MSLPAARVGDMSITGDAIIGPGIPTVLIAGMPAAVVGDLVSGAFCVGSITMGSLTVLISGRPAAHLNSLITGTNPVTGVPVTTTVGITGAPTVLIGG